MTAPTQTQRQTQTRVPIHWTLDYKHLQVGATYVVEKAFRDFDRIERNVGDGFLYLGHNYFAKEDGLTLYVALANGDFDTWRLQCSAEEQGPVADALEAHVVASIVPIDQAAFMRTLAKKIGEDNTLSRALGLELVARMPSVTPDVAAAVRAHLARDVADGDAVTLLMALYNVAVPDDRTRVEALRDRLSGDARTIADAVLEGL